MTKNVPNPLTSFMSRVHLPWCRIYFKKILQVFFVGPLIPLFWTSGDVCPSFQSHGLYLACFLACVILRFTSGVAPADCMVASMTAEPFQSTYLQMYWWKFGVQTHNHLCGEHSHDAELLKVDTNSDIYVTGFTSSRTIFIRTNHWTALLFIKKVSMALCNEILLSDRLNSPRSNESTFCTSSYCYTVDDYSSSS